MMAQVPGHEEGVDILCFSWEEAAVTVDAPTLVRIVAVDAGVFAVFLIFRDVVWTVGDNIGVAIWSILLVTCLVLPWIPRAGQSSSAGRH